MKSLTNILALTLLIALLTSCSRTLDNKIDFGTIEKDIKEIKATNPDFDSTKTDILDNLLALSKGRDNYIKVIAGRIQIKDGATSLGKYVVEEDKFKEIVDNLFDHFKANNITYRAFLTEIDSLKSLEDKYDNKLKSVYEKIDKLCNEKQKEADERDKKGKEIGEKLNTMVDLEVISIKETKWDYRDVVEVQIKMTNKTNKPIEAIGFKITLTDKLGEELADLAFKSNNRFTTTRVASYIYDEYEHSDIYKALRNTKVSHITAKKEISKINIDGEIISAHPDNYTTLLDINHAYKTPKTLNGYCPYLDKENELVKIIDVSKEDRQKEIKNRFPLLSKYQDELQKLLRQPMQP